MVFNGQSIDGIVFIIIFFWLLGVTIYLVRMVSHYNRLTHGVTNKNLKEILEGILAEQLRTSKKILDIETTISKMQLANSFHIQRIGIVRFNPFSDTGGSQSFTLAFLDQKSNGIVMTALYARNGTRWYIKQVGGGIGKELALSKEEEQAVKEAMSEKHTIS